MAGSAEAYDRLRRMLASPGTGKLVLFGFSACLVYHLFNGLRHLVWDIGLGLRDPAGLHSGYAVIALAGGADAGIWCVRAAGGAA